MRRLSKAGIVVITIVAVLIVIRLCLPSIVKYYANKTLQNNIEGYTGSIEDVDIHLYRGAYAIKALRIDKKQGELPVPFVSVDEIDFSIEWRSLFKGALVATIKTFNPRINFVDGPSEEQSQTGEEGNWQEAVKELFPLQINTFAINNGEVHFQNFSTKPKVDVAINQIHLVARNFTNTEKLSGSKVATINGEAKMLDKGHVKLSLEMNPLQEQPPFDMNFSLENVPLVELNDFMKAYAGVDAEEGTFALFSEMTGENNQFKGYVKPIFKNVKILDLKEDKHDPISVLKEAGIDLLTLIFRNHSKDQVATKIPISGSFDNPDVNVWRTIMNVLRNAFIEAINPKLDGTVDMGKLDGTEKELKKQRKEERKEERKEKREEKKEERRARREERKKDSK
jgi:hypothetical protein